jgi:ABC-type sugar transport system permease subunit
LETFFLSLSNFQKKQKNQLEKKTIVGGKRYNKVHSNDKLLRIIFSFFLFFFYLMPFGIALAQGVAEQQHLRSG